LTFNDTGSTSYVSLLPSLDDTTEVTLDEAREFPGYAPADAAGGQIFVGSGDAPTVTRFSVTDGLEWSAGSELSFGSYSSTSLAASIYVNAHKAYMPFDATSHVVWDPTDFSIKGKLATPEQIELKHDGLGVRLGYSHETVGDAVFQPYYFSSDDYQQFAGYSQVSIIDTTRDEVRAVADAPCPHFHITTQDDDGNVYFSNGQESIASSVLDSTQPKNCLARIKVGENAIDTDFTVHFADLTEGREGSNFFYIGNGIGFFNVYHAERDKLSATSEAKDVNYSANYHLWTLDLASMKAQIMDGIDYSGGQYVAFRIDGRIWVAIPAGDYSTTAVYEVLSTGKAQKRFDVQGWDFKMFRVR
jgi:hypothetical protein